MFHLGPMTQSLCSRIHQIPVLLRRRPLVANVMNQAAVHSSLATTLSSSLVVQCLPSSSAVQREPHVAHSTRCVVLPNTIQLVILTARRYLNLDFCILTGFGSLIHRSKSI
ncbi:hypothetical protein HYC85_028392 [Camellia sinensis]|uniref:Uncharacterized protein n=1 Tax=Camellia sinensis TaxID=4442 RepID=A0A7J7FW86_CAMSI|nr:hypothetical protein HYC85_028392 [Camellia sinensis]